jgi:hypothetical protein
MLVAAGGAVASRVAQGFATETEQLILRSFSQVAAVCVSLTLRPNLTKTLCCLVAQNTPNPAERNLQKEAKSLTQYLST